MHNKFFPSRRVAALHVIVELMMCFFSAARERAQTRERASYEKPTRGQWKHQRLSSNRPIIFCVCASCDPPTRVITGRVYLSICGQLQLLTAAADRWRWTRPAFNLSVELRADRVSDGKQSGDHLGFYVFVFFFGARCGWNGRTSRNSLINGSEKQATRRGTFLRLLIVQSIDMQMKT